jgi:hypothetical protein
MALTMSLLSGRIAGISILSSREPILKINAVVMFQNKGGVFQKNHL